MLGNTAAVFFNTAAFGTFNSADAGITLHCVYNPDTKKYSMDYKYCLIDYYDYDVYPELQDQDMLGLAQSYELYGWLNDTCTWEKGKAESFKIPWH